MVVTLMLQVLNAWVELDKSSIAIEIISQISDADWRPFCFRGGIMIEDWIEQYISDDIRHTGSGNEIHICCPVCGDSRYRLYISLVTGQVYCHNCQFKGTVVNLIQFIEGISYNAARERFNNIKGNIVLPDMLEKTVERRLISEKIIHNINKRPIPLPEEFQLIFNSNNLVAQRAKRYLMRRGITVKQIEEHNMGVCATGEYAHRIIIPIYQEGKLKFWIARAMSPESKLKERSPSNLFYQYSKSEVIFNLDKAAKNYQSAVISEGIFDALSWGGIGISLLGKSLYDAQFNLLLSYRNQLSDGLYVALDADAERDAMVIARVLSSFFPVKIIRIPPEFDDPNQYLLTHSKRDMWNLITCAADYGEFTSLRSKLQNL